MRHFRSADSIWYRTALYLAFASIYLLFAGPLLSQLQAAKQPHAHDHSVFCGTLPTQSSSNNLLHHWDHKCGYCGIWQQTPSAPQHLPIIGSFAYLACIALPMYVAQHSADWRNYPDASPRAPPL